MMLKSDNLLITEISEEDSSEILEIYNSNKHFLVTHLDKKKVDLDWVIEELDKMRKMNYLTFKIIELSSGKVIGFIDFKLHEESYLSLLMIHNNFKNNGYGKEAYTLLEEHFLNESVRNVRIDVVYDYDNSVMKFWIDRGFNKVKNIQLQWDDQYLGAAMMKKAL